MLLNKRNIIVGAVGFLFSFFSLLVCLCLGCQKKISIDDDPPVEKETGSYDVNLAIGGEVFVSSENPGEEATFLIDGKTGRESKFYSSLNSSPRRDTDHEEWIEIKLAAKQQINQIHLYPVATEIHEGFPIDFKIQISEDGSHWKDVVEVTDHELPQSAEPIVFSFGKVSASHVRMVAERLRPISNNWTDFKDVYLLRLSEIEVYLSSAQANSVILDKYYSVAGTATSVKAKVGLNQVPAGTSFTAELVHADETPLTDPIKKTAASQGDLIEIVLDLPATLPTGEYKVKVGGEVKGNPIALTSKNYKILDIGNRSFYISDSQGNDNNDGLSEDNPIKTLAHASTLDLLPGDKLLLKRGDIWENQKLTPKGNGTSELPIIISAYGNGDQKPHIKPNYQEYYGIRIVNSAGYEISDLEISNVMGGIVVWLENTYNHKYLKIENCYLHDMTDQGRPVPSNIPDLLYGMGISIAGSDDYGGKTLLSDIYIEDCEIDLCDVGIQVIGRDHDPIGRWNSHDHHKISRFAFLNVNIKDSKITRSYRTGGVMLYCITGGKSENLLVDQTGYNGVGMWWGVCAFQVARVTDYVVENCTFSNTIKGNSPDGQGFDWEADAHNVVVRKCRFINNEGPATLNYGQSWPGENSGCVLEECYIEGNNWISDSNDDYYKRVFGLNKNRPANNGVIRNCEIHLRSDDQNFWSFPLVFDESNKVYDTNGNLIYSGVDRSQIIVREEFHNLSDWNNSTQATIEEGKVNIKNNNLIYLNNSTSSINYFVESEFLFKQEGSGGLAFNVENQDNFYLLEANVRLSMMSDIVLYHVQNGRKTKLERIEAHGLRPNTAFTLRVNVYGNKVDIYSQGSKMGSYESNRGLISKHYGLYMGETGSSLIDNFNVYSL